MKTNYIKMNHNKNILSLGNIIDAIKEVSVNKKTATQGEIFYSIFDTNDINITAINNYSVGIRAIPIELKKKYISAENKDSIIKQLLYIINDEISENEERLIILNNDLYKIVLNDTHIDEKEITRFNKENEKEKLIEFLRYAIINNIQPVYTSDIQIDTNSQELKEYLKIKLYFGENYFNSIIELAKKDNMYACCELGSLYYDGLINGYNDYDNAYVYFKKAAEKKHPKAAFMIANMILKGKLNESYDIMEKYLGIAIKLNSAAAYNTLGLCYLKGINKEHIVDIKKAEKLFIKSGNMGYCYAFNNLGKMYEAISEEKSIEYYKISASMNQSWALNKVGEYYRCKGDLITAFDYYQKAISCPIREIEKYAYYNLAKYYYEKGYKPLNIKKDSIKATKYYELSK